MGALFSKPKIPAAPAAVAQPTPAPPPPDVGAPAVRDAQQGMRQRAAAAQGRQSTLLVSGTSDAVLPNRRKTLLGE